MHLNRGFGVGVSDQRCRIYNIFNILNSFRLTSKLKKILSYLGHIPLKGSCIDCKLYTGFLRKSLKIEASIIPFWEAQLNSLAEIYRSHSRSTFSPDSCQSQPPEALLRLALGRWWWWGQQRCWRRRRGRRWSRRCRRWTSQCGREGLELGLRMWLPSTAGARQANPGDDVSDDDDHNNDDDDDDHLCCLDGE